MTAGPEGLPAALHQLSEHAGRLTALDEREAGHWREAGTRLTDLAATVTSLSGALQDQAAVLTGIGGMAGQVAVLAERAGEIVPADERGAASYTPAPAPRWWALQGEARDGAAARLRAWVEEIFRPGYGLVSAALGSCWESHPICLYGLDWLSELWSVLYLQSGRTAGTLSAQAEFQTRILPAIAGQMAAETSRCDHGRPARAASGTRTGALS
jgi:hypothetical protein